MAFCTFKDVESEFKNQPFSDDTSVSDLQVEDWIDQYTQFIKARLAHRYVFPTDDTTLSAGAKAILKLICVDLVAAKATKVLRQGMVFKEGETPADRGATAKELREQGMKQIQSLEVGTTHLPGVEKAGPRFRNSNQSSSPQRCPVFQTNKTQW